MKIDFKEIKAHFKDIIRQQIAYIESIKSEGNWIDYNSLKLLIIGIVGGDGIGKHISIYALNILEFLLKENPYLEEK